MKTHWKKLRNPDYLGAYSFDEGPDGKTQDKILTIKSVANETVTGPEGSETCMVMRFAEPEKPLIVNATNAKQIQKLLKTPYVEEWAGHRIQLFATQVKAFGEMTEAVRIRPYLPKTPEVIKCADCQADIAPAHGMTADGLASYTKKKYGRQLCAECATKAAQPTAHAETPPPEDTKEALAE